MKFIYETTPLVPTGGEQCIVRLCQGSNPRRDGMKDDSTFRHTLASGLTFRG